MPSPYVFSDAPEKRSVFSSCIGMVLSLAP